MKAPRILLAAPASGSGKTLVTCGILQALKNRNLNVAAFKCGPDYIDPMFHGRVLGITSKNLDTFFTEDGVTKYLFGKEAQNADISVIEGVMGYYDGVAGVTTRASAYDVARVTESPVVLVVNAKGMSLSVVALIRGFLEYKEDSNIRGVILNCISGSSYSALKDQIESQLPVKVLGYVPRAAEYEIESRHLGLVTPNEITSLQEKLQKLADTLEQTLDMDTLLSLANEAEDFSYAKPCIPRLAQTVHIGIARDEAFCFYYRDNLEILEDMGAEIYYFSPLKDKQLPDNLDGLIFYGGYPELYAKELSANETMKEDIRKAIERGIPYMAECGGFMYLHHSMEDLDKNTYPMVGIVPGKAYGTGRLNRFGYITLTARKDHILGKEGIAIKGHEFHYFDSTENGDTFCAVKPVTEKEWQCMHGDMQGIAGFPHLYYYSNPDMIFHFLTVCRKERS